jgi:hypothetical protein
MGARLGSDSVTLEIENVRSKKRGRCFGGPVGLLWYAAPYECAAGQE